MATKTSSNGNGTANRVGEFMAEAPVTIAAPNYKVAEFRIRGTAPLVQNRFANKGEIIATQQAGSTAKKGKKRDPKDFDALYRKAMHLGPKGEYGIPAPAFRAACIDACRMTGFAMTRAKMSIFIQADFLGEDGTPLVRLDAGEPECSMLPVRNSNGSVDIRARPMWREWGLKLRVQYNADQFTLVDIANLLSHAGISVGIGEGRPYSKDGSGCGWGTFELVQAD